MLFLQLIIVAELGFMAWLIARIWRKLNPPSFTISIRRIYMALGTITPGSVATFQAALNQNGTPIAATAPWNFSTSAIAAAVTVTADPTIVEVLVAAGDPSTSITVTASTTAPDGTTVTGSIIVPVTATAQTFTVTLAQLS